MRTFDLRNWIDGSQKVVEHHRRRVSWIFQDEDHPPPVVELTSLFSEVYLYELTSASDDDDEDNSNAAGIDLNLRLQPKARLPFTPSDNFALQRKRSSLHQEMSFNTLSDFRGRRLRRTSVNSAPSPGSRGLWSQSDPSSSDEDDPDPIEDESATSSPRTVSTVRLRRRLGSPRPLHAAMTPHPRLNLPPVMISKNDSSSDEITAHEINVSRFKMPDEHDEAWDVEDLDDHEQWVNQNAILLDPEHDDAKLVGIMLLQVVKRRPKQPIFAQEMRYEGLSMRSKSNAEFSRCMMPGSCRRRWLKEKPANGEVLRLRPHAKMVLGETRWNKLLHGMQYYGLFGTDTQSINQYIFFLDKQTAHFKVARLKGSDKQKHHRQLVTGSDSGFGKSLRLDALYKLDKSEALRQAVKDYTEINSVVEPNGVLALWAHDMTEPLICVSAAANDVEDLIAVIRFLQFYHGLSTAAVIK